MDPVRELPYWPAANALHIEAGQMAASDYVPTYPNLLLASEGASTDAVRSAFVDQQLRAPIRVRERMALILQTDILTRASDTYDPAESRSPAYNVRTVWF